MSANQRWQNNDFREFNIVLILSNLFHEHLHMEDWQYNFSNAANLSLSLTREYKVRNKQTTIHDCLTSIISSHFCKIYTIVSHAAPYPPHCLIFCLHQLYLTALPPNSIYCLDIAPLSTHPLILYNKCRHSTV